MKRIIYITLLSLVCLPMLAQTTRYVVESGNGSKDGSSWTNASDNLQATIDKSSAGNKIFVAAGTYKGGFVMKNGVAVLGGFPSGGNPTEADRKLPGTGENLTILDGENKQRVVTQHVDFATPALWEGFVIQNGKATGTGAPIMSIDGNNDLAGVLYNYNANTGMGLVVSVAESATMIEWSNEQKDTKATEENNGQKNLDAMCKYIKDYKSGNWDNYPAWQWAINLEAGGYADWRLPAIHELGAYLGGFANRTPINQTLKAFGEGAFKNARYWSGSEYSNDAAWYGNSTFTHHIPKYNSFHWVRAVRAFNVFNHLAIFPQFSGLSGGGAHLLGGGTLRNCIVRNNAALFNGGGIYASAGAQVEGCVVEGNTSPDGSGVYSAGATLLSNTIVGNTVNQLLLPTHPVPPAIGNYYYTDGTYSAVLDGDKNVDGIVFYLSEDNPYSGLIVHTQASQQYGNDAETWAKSYNAGVYDTWRLPHIDELMVIYKNKTKINEAIGTMGTKLVSDEYWSGSQANSTEKWSFNLSNGSLNIRSNVSYYDVRAVRAF